MNTEVAMQWEESTAVVQSGPTLQGRRLPEALANSGVSGGNSGITQVHKQREGKERSESLRGITAKERITVIWGLKKRCC